MCTVSGAMCGRRPGDQLVRDSDLFTETLDRPVCLQYVLLVLLMSTRRPGDTLSTNQLDDDTGNAWWSPLAGVSGGWQGLYRPANIKTAEGNSRFSGS